MSVFGRDSGNFKENTVMEASSLTFSTDFIGILTDPYWP